MVPRIGRQGSSFKGAALYYLHDKDADTAHRIEHAETRNLPTQDPEIGWRVMAATAQDADRLKQQSGADRRGAKSQKPVFHLSNSWHPEQRPDREHMVQTMDDALAALGLQKHQAVYVIHNDEPHPHIHAFVNLVNPETGRSHSPKFSKEKLSKWAEDYERQHGIYCEQRIENNAQRAKEKARRDFNRGSGRDEQKKAEYARHKEREHALKAEITRRYHGADSGKAFRVSMAELGFTVAQGRKRIVLIDADGKEHSITRQLEGVKAHAVREKLKDIELPRVEDVRRDTDQQRGGRDRQADDAKRQQADTKQEPGDRRDDEQPQRPPKFSREHAREEIYFDRDQQERQQAERVIDAGIRQQKAEVRTGLLNRLQDAHIGQWGRFYEDSHQQRHRLDETLGGQYGAHERALRSDIHEREIKLQQAGRLRLWYLKNFTHEIEALDNDRLTLANIEQRQTEARAALEAQIEERRAAIEQRHAEERANVPQDFEPRELDPLARSIEQQQAQQSADYLGAAAPADTPPATTGDSASSGGDAGQDADRAAFMNEMNEQHGHEGPGLGHGGGE